MYEFYSEFSEASKAVKTVASFPAHNVVSVIDEDNYLGRKDDSEDGCPCEECQSDDECGEIHDSEYEDDLDDTCLDCRFDEFLGSEEFFSAVYDAVEAILGEDEPDFFPAPEAAEPEPKVEKRLVRGNVEYGFRAPCGWIGFGDISEDSYETAANSMKMYSEGVRGWYCVPVEETELVEEN
jgi:hypothetical protein